MDQLTTSFNIQFQHKRSKMNHCVPDFDIHHIDDDEDYPVHLSKKPSTQQDDEIMELLWQNGQV
ncbi:transcription factor PIF1-like, partial [Trifolium medium]|nr:transcription factor PIF1-like [Trifolium medium]